MKTLTTVEELDALPVGSAVVENVPYGDVYVKLRHLVYGTAWFAPADEEPVGAAYLLQQDGEARTLTLLYTPQEGA